MTLRVAMIGHGFMGAAHSVGWRQAPRAFELPAEVAMAVVVGRNQDSAEVAARKWGWLEASDDWRRVIARDDIDIIDIVTPGDSHAEIAIAALAAGKHVLCEKPLANTLAEAITMAEAAASAKQQGARAMLGFTYRRVPAVELMRRRIMAGALGRIHHVRVSYRQDWLVDPLAPLSWRLKKELAGSGALGDIGAHAIDLAQHVTGSELTRVSGVLDTVITERPVRAPASGESSVEYGAVTVDDLAIFTGRFANGALGSFEATRFATGRKNALSIEVSGEHGALAFDLEDLNVLQSYDRGAPAELQGFTKILVTEPGHPYLKGWWPAGHMLGYEHGFSHQAKDLVEAIMACIDPRPTFEDGLRVQRVLDAIERSAQLGGVWTAVDSGLDGSIDQPRLALKERTSNARS